jgi:hypothetical protein
VGRRGNRNPREGTRKDANNFQILAEKEEKEANQEGERQDIEKELPNQENMRQNKKKYRNVEKWRQARKT